MSNLGQNRLIIHIDMDAFFASVEQRDHPELRGKPLAVGGDGARGVVAAASYEARVFGVFSAMSSKVAKRKCPDLIFVRARFEVYREVSHQVREILQSYTDLVEPLSLDEAYVDISARARDINEAIDIAQEIKDKIKEKTVLTASAGVSVNKFLAKIASDYDKPNGLYVIPAESVSAFVAQLPIEKFHGIGKVTAAKMKKLGIYKGGDLRQWDKASLIRKFGKLGNYYYHIAQGIDNREVNPNRIRKSIGAERTFAQDLYHKSDMLVQLEPIAIEVWDRLQKQKRFGKTLTLKVKFSDFKQITRSKTLPYAIDKFSLIQKIYQELLASIQGEESGVRLLGLQISNLEKRLYAAGKQLDLEF